LSQIKNSFNNLDIELENYLNKFEIKFSSILHPLDNKNKLEIKNYFECTDHLNENGHIILKDIVRNKLIALDERY